MDIFTSKRERRFWILLLAVVTVIYSTLGLSGRLAASLREQNLLGAFFGLGFILIIAAVFGSGLNQYTGQREIWAALGIAAVYGMVIVRLFISPEERTHLVEYGIVATLIYHALTERTRNGRKVVPSPAIYAVAVTIILGWIDEGIQAILPNRIYDIRDVGFNALAGIMAIAAILILKLARQRDNKNAPNA